MLGGVRSVSVTLMSASMIAIRDLRFSWPDGDFRLRIPSLDVTEKSAVAVTGPSGSGKTTLLSIIAGILAPDSGTVSVDEMELTQLSESRRRAFRLQRIGLVFQSFELIEYLNVLDNVLLPARISSAVSVTTSLRERARDLLQQAGLEKYASRSITRLSQGERQRVAICRALLTDPPLLLADEPTGNLDPDSTQRIVEILLNQVRDHGATLLMVSHDHTLLPQFDVTVDFSTLCEPVTAAEGGDGAA